MTGKPPTRTTPGRNNAKDGKGRFMRSVQAAQRDAEAARLRSEGHTLQSIVDRLGFHDRAAASRAIAKVYAETVTQPVEEIRARDLATLDELEARAWEVLRAKHVTVSHGKVVDIDGVPLADDAPVLNAIDRVLKVQDRRAKLLGLDAPTRAKVELTDTVTAEIQRLAAELGMQ